MRSGQVSNQNYGLRTFGARVPVPWLIGSGGWAIYFHYPFGTFDTSGEESKFTPVPASLRGGGRGTPPPPLPETSTFALPIDLFFVASREPAIIMAEWARLTGTPSCRRCGASAISNRTGRSARPKRFCRKPNCSARKSSRATP